MTNAIIAAAIVVGLFIAGIFAVILLPNRALPESQTHTVGDLTSGGLLRTVALQI